MSERHYLERELYHLVQSDASIFEFLQAGSLDGVWYWDLEDPEHEWMSTKFWETFGHDPSRKKHLASEWQDMIFPEDRELALKNFQAHLADPTHPYDQVVRYRHRDGSTVWVRCRGMAVRDADGTPRRMLGAHTDVTALKKAEAELRVALESNYELEQFAYVASHDLSEPLRIIVTYLELLAERAQLDETSTKFLQTASGAATRMQVLIRGLLEYSRLGGRCESPMDVRANELVDNAMAGLRASIEHSGAEISVAELPRVCVEPVHGVQVFHNLISNAIKYADGTPVISISVAQTENGPVFCVRDEGIGIAPEQHARVFQMFQRLHGPDEYEGVGIGLALVKRIVERHGGTIWIESSAGAGTAFHFTLPPARGGS